jgi:GntR family transcriptional repressor for pyruvate dehydrogenase complex
MAKNVENLSPVVRESLVEQVSSQLIDQIAAGHWKQGEKLPTEPVLCRSLGIGRSTLREALNSLVFLGVVEVRRGEGTFVGAGNSTRMLDRFLRSGLLRTERDIQHLCEARILLESELVELCARRASDAELQKLGELEARMETEPAVDMPTFINLDLQFHLAIAKGSQNPVLEQMLRTIRGLLEEWILRSQKDARARSLAQSGHTKILAALRDRQAKRAREAMVEHLEASFALMRKGG